MPTFQLHINVGSCNPHMSSGVNLVVQRGLWNEYLEKTVSCKLQNSNILASKETLHLKEKCKVEEKE